MTPIPLFVEICAGLASVSGALQHGLRWKPPISRLGRKTGYAEAILRVIGLRPRQGAECYLWAEADSDVAALLAAYTQPEAMRQIADTIRSWIPCPYGPHEGWCSRCKGTGRWDARDLWEVLRREKRRGLWEGGGATSEIAGFATMHGLTNPVPMASDADGLLYNTGDGGFTYCRREGKRPCMDTISRQWVEAASVWPPVLIAQNSAVEPGEVAGWMWVNRRSWKNDPAAGFMSKDATGPLQEPERQGQRYQDDAPAPDVDRASRVWPPVHLTPDATIQPPQIPPGTVVYIDGPYHSDKRKVTGYKHEFNRDEQIEAGQRWKHAGARVYISEGEPIQIAGWNHVRIDSERKGQARTFSNQQEEWLTCSHLPAWTPPQQAHMF